MSTHSYPTSYIIQTFINQPSQYEEDNATIDIASTGTFSTWSRRVSEVEVLSQGPVNARPLINDYEYNYEYEYEYGYEYEYEYNDDYNYSYGYDYERYNEYDSNKKKNKNRR
ncbi:hypothetical protein BDB00DRAFT_934075 [Zychaea mexicana]|uniref:uncharacterized protein n=1 Tax=Zychaea mexicana TaxID=64656 RepID=UPI0022FF4324|nr:uncharacterized protein BDB00DRAFT_934075 [Zychaea mexicana]KAI9477165.1 hypothetical protein BDB00DRAFT_934075 [Zychaea mexicana]